MADEKYRTQLTGAQVDDALQQLNQRVAEGWAVGTRDGSPVGSGTEYYHNNAKYWAEQSHSSVDAANAAAERAEAAVPAGTAGAVFFDREQSLTDTQKEQARQNIAAANSNPNLLDNGWFLLNSIGTTLRRINGYFIDRWKFTTDNGYNTYITVNSNHTLTVHLNGLFYMVQLLDPFVVSLLTGKVVTFSAIINNSLKTVTFTYPSSTSSFQIGNVPFFVRIPASQENNTEIQIYANFAQDMDYVFSAVKLELGSVSTLQYDSVPDYGTELTRCIYSTADPTDTYANNGFGRSNKNELDNPWFVQFSCVNQIGYTSSNSSGEVNCVDRWKVNRANASVTLSGAISSQGLSLAWNGTTSSEGVLTQRIDKNRGAKLVNNPVTVSVLLSDGTIYHDTFIYPSQATGSATVRFTSTLYCTLYNNLDAYATLNIYNQSTTAVKIQAVKLEKGTVSTLANETPPDTAEELLNCLHYKYVIKAENTYGVIGTGIIDTKNTHAMIIVNFPVPLRRIPGMTYSGSFRTISGNGNDVMVGSVSAMSLVSGSANRFAVRIDVTGTNMGNAGNGVILSADSSPSAQIIFDADIQ